MFGFKLNCYRDYGRANSHGRLYQFPHASMGAPPGHPQLGHRSRSGCDITLGHGGHRTFANFKSSGTQLSAALCHSTPSDVYCLTRENGGAGGPLMVEHNLRLYCAIDHRFKRETSD